jgi:hypothetical protein
MVSVRRARKSVGNDTQQLRCKVLKKLEAMFILAEKCVKTAKTAKQKADFMRVMGYIAQVMNSLSKTFDEATVTQDLQELEKMISEAMAKGKDKGAQAATSGSLGS